MKRLLPIVICLILGNIACAQQIDRPKLVVGIVIDQMRWDYLYRYYDRYDENGGFKRFLNNGFTCDNTFVPYAPTVTACGHACIYTGSVPAINGITGNIWYDNDLRKSVYCTEDDAVHTVGSKTEAGKQSPRNLLTTTIGDELKLATNFRAKVFGVAIKDRGSILPAGHTADGAYWFDYKVGKWVTSDYYMKALPSWAAGFDAPKMIDSYYKEGWKLLYPANTYLQSTEDDQPFESKVFGANATKFPYKLDEYVGNNYSAFLSTPFGNTLAADFAKQLVINEKLGTDSITDLLALSFSSPDYIGHAFGPNSVEVEDNYLRLDKTLGEFLDFLDEQIGKDQYTVFLSADHAVAHIPSFAAQKNIPSGYINFVSVIDSLNNVLRPKYRKEKTIVALTNYQVSIDQDVLNNNKINVDELKATIITALQKMPGVDRAFDIDRINQIALPHKMEEMFANGYNPHRSGQIQIVLRPQWLEGFTGGGTSHGLWNPYDSHIPLLWAGWGIKKGKSTREVYMTDISATLAALLHIQMPNGCIGKVIEEVIR